MPAEGRSFRWKRWRKGAGSREWPIAASTLGLIRTRGHISKGGYDVHHGSDSQAASSAATVHR